MSDAAHIDHDDVVAWLTLVAERVHDQKAYLTELDSAIGTRHGCTRDGHGIDRAGNRHQGGVGAHGKRPCSEDRGLLLPWARTCRRGRVDRGRSAGEQVAIGVAAPCASEAHAHVVRAAQGGDDRRLLRGPPAPGVAAASDQLELPSADVQQKQVAAKPELKVWVDAVGAAKGRTSDDLGTKYPKISQQMWTAVQAALSGSSSPASAMKTAQSSVK